MTGSKDVCGKCSAQFFGRQQFIVCSGPCDRRFHCKCLDIQAEEYDVLMKSGKSCFKCRDCTKRRNPSSTVLIDNDDGAGATPISAGSKLNIGTGDCDGTAQVGVSTEILALLTELTSRLDVLTAEVRLLRANNSALTTEVAQLREAVVNQTVADATKDAQSLGSPSAVSSYAEAVTSVVMSSGQRRDDPATATGATGDVGNRACQPVPFHNVRRDAADAGSRGNRQSTDKDGYTLVKKRRAKPATGANTESKISSVPRPPRTKALFVTRLHPATTSDDLTELLTTVIDKKTCCMHEATIKVRWLRFVPHLC